MQTTLKYFKWLEAFSETAVMTCTMSERQVIEHMRIAHQINDAKEAVEVFKKIYNAQECTS